MVGVLFRNNEANERLLGEGRVFGRVAVKQDRTGQLKLQVLRYRGL
jgi:hypothetical protein